MDSKGLEKITQLGNSSERLFDNPLTHRILSKEQVARVFEKSDTWVSRMMADGSLPYHYVGDTPMFDAQEILHAFLSDSLDKRRQRYDKKNKKQGRLDSLRGANQNRQETCLSEIRRQA